MVDYFKQYGLQMFAGVDDDDIDLDEFDLDLDKDDEDDGDKPIPKSKVTKLVKKRLAKEAEKQRQLYDSFREVYKMSPEEAIEYGKKLKQGVVKPPTQEARPAPAPASTPVAGEPAEANKDPILTKVAEIENQWNEFVRRQQVEREAAEFVQKYPGVKFEDIPAEVLERRSRGGLTLAEAYKLHVANQEVENAARNAAAAAAKNIKGRDKARTEGPDYSAGTPTDDVGTLTAEEVEFAKVYGMSPKEYLKYKQIISKSKQ